MEQTKKEQEEMFKQMAEAERELNKQLEEEHKKDEAVMDNIKSLFGEKIIKQIEEEFEESEGGWNLKIVDKPQGESEGDLLDGREVYVNQTCNGGYTGDEFAGEVYFKLPNNKWLKWDYSM